MLDLILPDQHSSSTQDSSALPKLAVSNNTYVSLQLLLSPEAITQTTSNFLCSGTYLQVPYCPGQAPIPAQAPTPPILTVCGFLRSSV